MEKNKIEIVDEGSYYRAFKSWLDSSSTFYDTKNESQMNEHWLKFADELGVYLGRHLENEKMLIEIADAQSWKEAKKFYSIMSFKVSKTEENLV
jgi:hypothetical protein